MAESSSPYARSGVDGITHLSPGTWARNASMLSEWCSGAWIPPPAGVRSTRGQVMRPRVRVRSLEAWFASWSRAG